MALRPFHAASRRRAPLRAGRLDMKGFGAVALAMIPEFKKAALQRPIHILLSYDEETTCLGPLDMIARLGVDLPRPNAVIVGEPTSMEVADAHKSVRPSGHKGSRLRDPLRQSASRRERGACRLPARDGAGTDRGGVARDGRPLRPLRSALLHRACRRHQRRHGAQHRRERLHVRMGVPRPARAPIPCSRAIGWRPIADGNGARPFSPISRSAASISIRW